MKRFLVLLLLLSSSAFAVDFTDTDQMYGWDGSNQFYPTFLEFRGQLGTYFEAADPNILKSTTSDLVGIVLQDFITLGGVVTFRSDSAVCDAGNGGHAVALSTVAAWGFNESNIICQPGLPSADPNAIAIIGISGTGSVGTLSAFSANAAATLSGVLGTGDTGTLLVTIPGDPNATALLSGVSGTGATGTVSPTTATESTIFPSLDNYTGSTNAVWATARAGSNLVVGTASANTIDLYASGDSGYTITRMHLNFTIPAGASITAARMYFSVADGAPTYDATSELGVQQGTHGATIEAADFTAVTGSTFGSVGVSTTGEKFIDFDSGGLTYLNTLSAGGGTAQLVLREFDHDVANVAPGSPFFGALLHSLEAAAQANRPRLVITR